MIITAVTSYVNPYNVCRGTECNHVLFIVPRTYQLLYEYEFTKQLPAQSFGSNSILQLGTSPTSNVRSLFYVIFYYFMCLFITRIRVGDQKIFASRSL